MVIVMTENKRYIVKGSDDFFLHIEDTTFTEDKHEGSIYNIYQVVRRLNEQEEEIRRLNHLVKIATNLIEWNTIPQIRREWKKHLNKVGDD